VTSRQAAAFVRKHGVALEAAAGPVPSLAEAIAGGPIRGSWWARPRSHEIFELTRAVRDSEDVLVCRLVDGKITYIHRRLWAPLVRVRRRGWPGFTRSILPPGAMSSGSWPSQHGFQTTLRLRLRGCPKKRPPTSLGAGARSAGDGAVPGRGLVA
jgi:hypothetical protein